MIDSYKTESVVENKRDAVNNSEGTESNELIAQFVQLEFNNIRDIPQTIINKPLKLPIVKDCQEPQLYSDEEERDDQDEREYNVIDNLEEKFLPRSHRGYKNVTKHNIVMNKSKNAYKLLTFPPAFQTCKRRISSKNPGFDMNSKSKPKKKHNIKQHDPKLESIIAEMRILNNHETEYERIMIYDLIHIGLLKSVNNIICISRKAVILHANYNPSYPNMTDHITKECVIKIFRRKTYPIQFCPKKNPYEFLDEPDQLFLCNLDNKLSTKEISFRDVRLWAYKEVTVLKRLAKTIVHCPQLITHRHNIVVMSFIGEHRRVAPTIKDVELTAEEYRIMYKEIKEAMRIMYQKKRIVHGKLSENSILWHNGHCYFIDFGLSLDFDHVCAYYVLYKDCTAIIDYQRGASSGGIVSKRIVNWLIQKVYPYSDLFCIYSFLTLNRVYRREKIEKHIKNYIEKSYLNLNMIDSVTESSVAVENKHNAVNNLEATESDILIARLLQMDFKRKHDKVRDIPQKFDKPSQKLIINDHLEQILNSELEDNLYEEEIDVQDRLEYDIFDNLEKNIAPTFHRGYKQITKHNVQMNKNKNGYKLLTFPPAFEKKRISSKNCNSFNINSKPKQRSKYKPTDPKLDSVIAEIKILNNYYDPERERLAISNMIHNGLIRNVHNIIHVGRTAIILHADYNPSYPNNETDKLTKECIVKIFRRKSYPSQWGWRNDPYCFSGYQHKRLFLCCFDPSLSRFKVITERDVSLWGNREKIVLKRLARTSVHCPQLITYNDNVVVMSFIGEKQEAAPTISDLQFTPKEYVAIYKEVVEAMKVMYEKANIIHGQLSENSILWHNGHCYFIDFGLSLARGNTCAYYVLYEDCNAVTDFFCRKHIRNIHTPDELFTYITGYDYGDKSGLLKLTESFRNGFRKAKKASNL